MSASKYKIQERFEMAVLSDKSRKRVNWREVWTDRNHASASAVFCSLFCRSLLPHLSTMTRVPFLFRVPTM